MYSCNGCLLELGWQRFGAPVASPHLSNRQIALVCVALYLDQLATSASSVAATLLVLSVGRHRVTCLVLGAYAERTPMVGAAAAALCLAGQPRRRRDTLARQLRLLLLLLL